MAVKTYSVLADGDKQVNEYFRVREFACKDGSDQVLIDDNLAEALRRIRIYFGASVYINSAYRTPSHNQQVGGSTKSQHLLGKAADIRIPGIEPLRIAQYGEFLGMGGVGLYKDFVHIDSRNGKARWDKRSGNMQAVSGFGGQEQFQIRSVYYEAVQKRFGLDENTMAYLSQYKYGEDLLRKLAGGQ